MHTRCVWECEAVEIQFSLKFLNEKHKSSFFTSRPAQKCSFSQVTLRTRLYLTRLSKSHVFFSQVLKHPANEKVFIFTSHFWFRNSPGGHEQNKNDVIFTSRRFDPLECKQVVRTRDTKTQTQSIRALGTSPHGPNAQCAHARHRQA